MFCRIRLTSFCYFTKLSGGLWSENLWINICYDVQTTGSVPTARLYRRGGQGDILSKPYKAARGVSYGTIPVIQPRMEGVTMKDWGKISIWWRFKCVLRESTENCPSPQGRVERGLHPYGGGGWRIEYDAPTAIKDLHQANIFLNFYLGQPTPQYTGIII